MYLEEGDSSSAVSLLQESLRQNPQAWDAHFELARCYYNTGKINEALAQALLARDSPQANPVTHLLLADIYEKQNLKKEALGELEAFVKANPASPMIPRVQRTIEQLHNNPR
jgi:tetratricopeptide (TPR) repeat protein